jgi:FkbM family methyltransferase
MSPFTKLTATLWSVAQHPLHRSGKIRAAARFSVTQVAARLLPGDVCVAFPNDTRLLVSPRMKGAAHFLFPGLCEFDTMSFVVHFLRPDDLFVDAGAYVGAYTVLAAGGARSRAIAFEPSPTTFSYLERNVGLNRLQDRVTPLNCALGNEEGTLRFTRELGTENHVASDPDEKNTIAVKVTTLDKILEREKPTLIKMDVEGFESKVIAGAQRTLVDPALQALIIERTGVADRYGVSEAELHQRIRSSPFEPCAYSPLDRTLRRLSPDDTGNIIYLRDFSAAQKRVREAAPYQFNGQSI